MSDPVDSDRNREHDLEPEWDPSVHYFPVWATIREAVQAIAKVWKVLLKAVAVPALVLTAVIVVLDGEYLGSLEDILLYLLSFGLLTMIAVSCHRLVILGADSLPNAWGLYWWGRETRFLGWIYGIWIIALAPLVLLIALPLFTATATPLLFGIPFPLALYPLALYVLARSSLVLPATAIGQRLTGWGSWRLSRSNGWRLALVMLIPLSVGLGIIVAAFFVMVESLQLGGIAPQFLAAFTLVLLLVFGIALLSKAYSWFAGEIEAKSPT